MTLVVSKIIGERVYIFADTKLTHPIVPLSGPIEETLKIVPIDSQHCVAYAGIQELAINAIRALIAMNLNSTNLVAEFLLSKNIESDGQCDFLLVSLDPKPEIFKIGSGKSSREIGSSWIGDPQAFSIFQNTFHSFKPPFIQEFDEEFLQECPHLTPENATLLSKMDAAFRQVLTQTRTPTVGGFLIRLLRRPGIGYTFQQQCEGFDFEPTLPTTEPQSLLRPKLAESGGYNFTLLASETPTTRAIGVWILQNNLGILYNPIQDLSPVLFPNTTCAEFVDAVASEHQIALTGILYS